MSGWRIRRAIAADAPGIWEVHTRAIREGASTHYPPDTIDAWAGRKSPASYAEPISTRVVLVAEDPDGGLAGFAQVDAKEGVVEACYVDPNRSRRGIGRALMSAIEDEARARGRTALVLDASFNAVPFYEALGWRHDTDGRRELVSGALLDYAIMSKRIA